MAPGPVSPGNLSETLFGEGGATIHPGDSGARSSLRTTLPEEPGHLNVLVGSHSQLLIGGGQGSQWAGFLGPHEVGGAKFPQTEEGLGYGTKVKHRRGRHRRGILGFSLGVSPATSCLCPLSIGCAFPWEPPLRPARTPE